MILVSDRQDQVEQIVYARALLLYLYVRELCLIGLSGVQSCSCNFCSLPCPRSESRRVGRRKHQCLLLLRPARRPVFSCKCI